MSGAPNRRTSPLAAYLAKQARDEWPDYAADEIEALVAFLPGKRMSVTFGSWRRGRRPPTGCPRREHDDK